MATLDTLCETGLLTKLSVPLGFGVQPQRLLYASSQVLQWIKSVVPALATGRINAPDTPFEQLDVIIHRWIGGAPMAYGRVFKDLMPARDEVWEMKTADLRIFGWMYRPCVFVAVLGDHADLYKPPNPKKSYGEAKKTVIDFRAASTLDPPLVASGTFDDLVQC